MISRKTKNICSTIILSLFLFSSHAIAQEKKVSELVAQCWEASNQRDLKRLDALVEESIKLFNDKALAQQDSLTKLPDVKQAPKYQELNDLGTILFVKAEAVMHSGQTEEAIKQFKNIIDNYSFSQSWDPRGWYWSVAEKSQDSIDVLTGKEDEDDDGYVEVEQTIPNIYTNGSAKIVDYSKYGKFQNVGKEDYHYRIKDIEGLAKAVGEGIYPNTGDIYQNPGYKKAKSEGRLEGSHWDFVISDDLEAAYYKWFTAPEPWGVRMFYVGLIFEKAGLYFEALRSYHSLIIHFPKTVGYTYWQTPWYPAQAAIAKIRHILRVHPELNYVDKYMKIEVDNGFDNDVKNDVIRTWPGKIIKKGLVGQIKGKLPWDDKSKLDKVTRRIGEGQVQLVQYENGHWQMHVEGKPYPLRGVTYDPTKVGQSPDKGTLVNWMEEDINENGLPDGPFDTWVDKNLNNKQDEDEPVIGDFQLMKEMGVNTIRLYHVPTTPKKEILRKLYNDYGIRVIMSDFLGKYAIGSGATWAEGTDYENEEHKKNLLSQVKKMVNEHKDEPYLLMWLLGNENNYGVASNADTKPEAYFKFANEVAQWIKSVDSNHPIALSNGDTLYLDKFAEHAPDIDIFAANVYRGDYGFGSFWEQVFDATGKPAFITEYGCPAYARHLTLDEADQAQADYHYGNWLDIEENMAGQGRGIGNALGGVVFEWLDEWWKNYEPYRHDKKSDAVGPFPGGYYFEEWFGIVGQGNGRQSPFLRQPRKSYTVYKNLWNKE